MKGLIRKSDGVLEVVVSSTDGYDLSAYDAHDLPVGDPTGFAWDGAKFITRPPSVSEQSRSTLEADELWGHLESATPAQIDNWLTANVTNITTARRVLKFILLALKSLRATQRL